MIASIRRWIEKRRTLRRLWQADAMKLIRQDESEAYYTAQRLAARARAKGDQADFLRWAKVAAEIARLSAVAKMDHSVVKEIVAEELNKQ